MSSADDSKHKQSATSTTTWLTLAAAVISDQREANTSTWSDASADDLLSVLKSFGAEDAPGPVTLDPCDGGTPADISNKIREVLVAEIDDDQAQMFARRFVSVSTLLMADGSEIDSMQATGTKATVDVNALLRLALHRRAVQILSASDDRGPKALRIRALVDFVWSQSLVLGKSAEERSGYPSLIELVKSKADTKKEEIDDNNNTTSSDEKSALRYEEFAPGFRHATITGQTSDFGPTHINVLRISPGCARMQCVDARTLQNNATGTLGCTDLVQLAKQSGALAAISGGFFLYSEPDIEPPSKRTDPVGLLVTEGKVVNPPVYRRAALMQDKESGEFSIHRVGMEGMVVRIHVGREANGRDGAGGSGTINDASPPFLQFQVGKEGVRYVTRADAKMVSLEVGEVAISIVGNRVIRTAARPMPNNSSIANETSPWYAAEGIAVPLAGFVVASRKWYPNFLDFGPLEDLNEWACAGNDGAELVTYHVTTTNTDDTSDGDGSIKSAISIWHTKLAGTHAAMAGGPILLAPDHDADDALELESEDFRGSAPPVTFSQDETFDRNLLPRMGAGTTKNGEIVMVAIDGRNLDQALGLTLQGTANLLEAFGCVKAMNLDGGSSKRMVIRHKAHGHKVVCLSTTEIKAASTQRKSPGNGDGAENGGGSDEVDVEAVEVVKEDMEEHSKTKKTKTEANVDTSTNSNGAVRTATKLPEPSRPVHSAILFLPPE
mmetsp:Transcript_27961/g.80797  ORF Transcript_27961/g.80797 Transcript_27961/m.80797 type:complete len:723 (-) Transcript_27961:179-2347(-)|eukprot:CAMPEP_0181056852 /NCGR_PEP_ID=MMETSP1070-20121207/19937_1 /TAXON_ID=265543 /ORGANISM="Minutocellus polymorphus, Strain NH13" /LENGTH=722 /DNA_ID=CAMNT_0023136225 /DNA_START=85 /DNA_END=2253 /DNA_ORIENTATION=+